MLVIAPKKLLKKKKKLTKIYIVVYTDIEKKKGVTYHDDSKSF